MKNKSIKTLKIKQILKNQNIKNKIHIKKRMRNIKKGLGGWRGEGMGIDISHVEWERRPWVS